MLASVDSGMMSGNSLRESKQLGRTEAHVVKNTDQQAMLQRLRTAIGFIDHFTNVLFMLLPRPGQVLKNIARGRSKCGSGLTHFPFDRLQLGSADSGFHL